MSDRPSPTIEDYLGVIYTLSRDNLPVYGRRLADWMEVSAPTVTVTLQRMVRDGWITMEPDKTIRLTEGGRVAAASVVRRHMLTELLLARVLNVPWSQVHGEADRLEHGLSAETASRVAQLLNGSFGDDMTVCPHGNPLPGQEEGQGELCALTEAAPDGTYQLVRVHEEAERDSAILALLEAEGLLPGTELTLGGADQGTPDDTIEVEYNGRRVPLPREIARFLWVREC